MFWQWLFAGGSATARIIALIAGIVVALYLHNAHGISNFYAYPIGFGVYLIVRLLWGAVFARPR
jgi:hypothetical protein